MTCSEAKAAERNPEAQFSGGTPQSLAGLPVTEVPCNLNCPGDLRIFPLDQALDLESSNKPSLRRTVVSEKLSSLRKRMAEVERQTADIARREKLADCNCYPRGKTGLNPFWSPEQFEAAANLPCPVHGFRRLGKIMIVKTVGRGVIRDEESENRLDQLVDRYYLRLSQLPPLGPELEYDSE